MKKFFSMMMIAAAAFAFAACESGVEGPNDDLPAAGSKLETPQPVVKEEGDTYFVIEWPAVKGAESYTLSLKKDKFTTTETTYKFENLNAGEYLVGVVAVGTGYKDSAFGTVTAKVTGATSVDWFTSTVKPAELNEAEGYGPYNAVAFTWKGTGVAKLAYGLYVADNLVGVDESDIKAALTEVKAETVAEVNKAEGLSSVIGPVSGATTYAMCILVTNDKGLEFFSMQEVTTETAVPSEAAKAWFGTWDVTSTQAYSINEQGEGEVIEEAETFQVTISASASDPNEVVIDGWSVLGEGWLTTGAVDADQLYILNGTFLGVSEDESFYYYWLGWYNVEGEETISLDPYPSNIVTKSGDTVASTNEFDLYDEEDNAYATICYCSDVFGINDAGNIYFLIKAFPGVYRTGNMTWTKSGAASAKAAKLDVAGFHPAALMSTAVVTR